MLLRSSAMLGEKPVDGAAAAPLHGGRSLVLRDGEDGRLLATCWAGCNQKATSLSMGGLMELDEAALRPQTKGRFVMVQYGHRSR